MGSFKIQVPVIVNSNTAQVLVVTEIPLSPPAFKIDEIDKLIEIDDSLSGQVAVARCSHISLAAQGFMRVMAKNFRISPIERDVLCP